ISAPIAPPPPDRLSTIMVCFRVSLILAPTVRPVMSVAPPGANGTTTRIGFAGYACASAPPAPQAPQLTAIRISLPVRNIFRPSSLPCYQSRVPALSAKRCASQPVDHHVIDSASILVRGKRYGGSQTERSVPRTRHPGDGEASSGSRMEPAAENCPLVQDPGGRGS